MDKESEHIFNIVQRELPLLKHGSLRIWGQFFGKPYDNDHVITSSELVEGGIRFHFDQGESLTVWNPSLAHINLKKFEIKKASRVRWEWYYYGREQIKENLYYIDYVLKENIIVNTNAKWFDSPSEFYGNGVAVELL